MVVTNEVSKEELMREVKLPNRKLSGEIILMKDS